MESIANRTKSENTEPKALPCLYSNNSNETALDRLSTQHKKTAISLSWNVEYMAEKYGLETLAFTTLTFPFVVTCMKEAQKLFNILQTAFLRDVFPNAIWVKERDDEGKIHFHGLTSCGFDIRTGFDFAAVSNRDYSSANPRLKRLWSLLCRNLPKYKFGRSEVLPIKSTTEAISRYVGSYIKKGVKTRTEADKGTRLINYSGDSRNASTRFTVISEGSYQWRQKLKLFCRLITEVRQDIHFLDQKNIAEVLGKHWCYHWREFILNLPDQPQEKDS